MDATLRFILVETRRTYVGAGHPHPPIVTDGPQTVVHGPALRAVQAAWEAAGGRWAFRLGVERQVHASALQLKTQPGGAFATTYTETRTYEAQAGEEGQAGEPQAGAGHVPAALAPLVSAWLGARRGRLLAGCEGAGAPAFRAALRALGCLP